MMELCPASKEVSMRFTTKSCQLAEDSRVRKAPRSVSWRFTPRSCQLAEDSRVEKAPRSVSWRFTPSDAVVYGMAR